MRKSVCEHKSAPLVGVIAEFNPFHNGHAYLLQTIRHRFPDSTIIVAMSGNFTQRGEVAILPKWLRARIAVESGADLVLELPVVFSLQSAEGFARGGVSLLARAGIDYLAFGCETDCLTQLEELAEFANSSEAQCEYRKRVGFGKNYASIWQNVLESQFSFASDILRGQPNAVLALEYLKAKDRFAPHLHPFLCVRAGKIGHNSSRSVGCWASGQGIRNFIFENPDAGRQANFLKKVMPDYAARETVNFLAEQVGGARIQYLERTIFWLLRTSSLADIQEILGSGDGLAEKIQQSAFTTGTWNDLLVRCKSKNCHYTRLQRSFMQLLVGVTKRELSLFKNVGALYLRLLAFSPRGQRYLKRNRQGTYPFLNKISHRSLQNIKSPTAPGLAEKMFAYDIKATNIYTLCLPNAQRGNMDFYSSIYRKQ